MYAFVAFMIVVACICAVLGDWFMIGTFVCIALAIVAALSWDGIIDSLGLLFNEDERRRKAYCKVKGLPYIKMRRQRH